MTDEENALFDSSSMKRIYPDNNLPVGTVLYAEDEKNNEKWLILVSKVFKGFSNDDTYIIERYFSYNIESKITFFDPSKKTTSGWGTTDGGFLIYIATPEQKKYLIQVMAKNNVKYVKALNKLITR